MAPRVTSDVLLVGSLPADSTRTALGGAGQLFPDMVFALPDGETGARAAWVGYERNQLFRPHPDLELVSQPSSPDGIPRHAYDAPSFRVRPGVTAVHFDHWNRIDEAVSSYAAFRSLRDEGRGDDRSRRPVPGLSPLPPAGPSSADSRTASPPTTR